MFIVKVRPGPKAPWQYVDELNCVTDVQDRARRFRDRRVAQHIAAEFDPSESKVVELVSTKQFRRQQQLYAIEDAARVFVETFDSCVFCARFDGHGFEELRDALKGAR